MWIPRTWCMCFTQTPIYTHSLLLSSSLLLEFMLLCLACGIHGYVGPTCFNYMLVLSSFTFISYISITTCVCCIIEIQDELGLANAHNLLWTHSKVSVKVLPSRYTTHNKHKADGANIQICCLASCSTSRYYINLRSGLWNRWSKQKPKWQYRDHLVGQLTRLLVACSANCISQRCHMCLFKTQIGKQM